MRINLPIIKMSSFEVQHEQNEINAQYIAYRLYAL